MLNDNIKNLILGTINLYENSNLNQAIIDEGFQKLKQAKKLLTEQNEEVARLQEQSSLKLDEVKAIIGELKELIVNA